MNGPGCVTALKALGEETRIAILRLLLKDSLTVNEISERLHATQYNISKHLRIMREAGLLVTEKRGRERVYAVATNLKSQASAECTVLDLECCTFRLDKL